MSTGNKRALVGILEDKFNIEIAKDRIKEKEIHEEIKGLLIQRK